MAKYTVLIVDQIFSTYEEEKTTLGKIDAEVITSTGSEENFGELIAEADGVIVNLNSISADLIGTMKRCKAISRYGVGFDNVDIDAATKKGIWVMNVPDYAKEDVSDHAVALLMACIRKIAFRDAQVRKGSWNIMEQQRSWRTKGNVMGILGFGNIGAATAKKLSGFGFAKMLVCDPYIDQEEISKTGAEPVDLDTILAQSDYLSIHVPLNDETQHMICAETLKKMKSNAMLVNTARGGVIDTEALVDALTSGEIAYAGLDVHENEPLEKDSALFGLDNVVLSDHCAWYTEDSLIELKTRAAQNVATVLIGNQPETPVNKVE